MDEFHSFGNSRHNRTTDMGENVPLKLVFGFHSAGMRVFEEKTEKQYWISHFPQKRLSLFLFAYFSIFFLNLLKFAQIFILVCLKIFLRVFEVFLNFLFIDAYYFSQKINCQ